MPFSIRGLNLNPNHETYYISIIYMTLQDHIHSQTREIRDAIRSIDIHFNDIREKLGAFEERLKRISTEITRCRTLEIERKRLLNETEDKETDLQKEFDELEQRRTVLLDRLLERRAE